MNAKDNMIQIDKARHKDSRRGYLNGKRVYSDLD